ncbi:hypothetical protein [Serratia quinivorans]|uniref:hypothetical protein n=1 Tax=Serratia quinivorans TaxID=137545 RepID=UPI0034C6CAD0
MYNVLNAIPSAETVIALRESMGLTQTQLGKLMGLELRQWQRKEAVGDAVGKYAFSPLNIGEYNLLLLLAGCHPHYALMPYSPEKFAEQLLYTQPTANEVKSLRKVLGLKVDEVATLMGYTLSSWKSKQQASKSGTLKPAEYNFMLLLAGLHPVLKLTPKKGTPGHAIAGASA